MIAKKTIDKKKLFEPIQVENEKIDLTIPLLKDVLFNASIYGIDDDFNNKVDVPILHLRIKDGFLESWDFCLCDINEVKNNRAEACIKGVIEAQRGFVDNTPKVKSLNLKSDKDKYVIISYGGYASLIKATSQKHKGE